MARPSPITIGLTVLTATVLAAAIFVIARPRHADPVRTIEIAAEPAPPRPAPVAPPPRATPVAVAAPVPAAARPREPEPAAPPLAAVVTPDPGTAADAPRPMAGPSTALVRNHNRRLDAADDETFKLLNLPEAMQARVRAINDEHRKRTEGDPSAANMMGAAQTRRDQLRLLLGDETARQFDTEERAAVRRLRGKYRFEWGAQGRGK